MEEAAEAAEPEGAEAEEEEEEEEEGEEAEEQYAVDEPVDVAVLCCVLGQQSSLPGDRRIWRRVALPSDSNLLELHVALQNAFDFEDTHLHEFRQSKKASGSVPRYPGFGRTDLSKLPAADTDSANEDEIRTFQLVVGIPDAAGGDYLTPASDADEANVFVQHSHPHQEALPIGPDPVDKLAFASKPKQVLDERAFRVSDVLNSANPVLIYEYDFGVSHEISIFWEGEFSSTEGIDYPTCLAGAGASRAEDGNDTDDTGNLLDSYDYDEFAVIEVLRNFEKTYQGLWPAGPGAVNKTEALRCYMCRYTKECSLRRRCSGDCCTFCLKSMLAVSAGAVALDEADAAFDEAAARVHEARRQWVEEGRCTWVERDGQPCNCKEE
eukprot:SM000018S03607  [mRNA]  locus=s18:232725:235514:- [translate_table: standard]